MPDAPSRIRPYRTVPALCALVLATLLLGACGEDPLRALASRSPSVDQVVSEPGRHRGREVAWGGVVVESHNLREFSELQILSYPLGDGGRPRQDESPSGRFLARRTGYLETAEYAPGRLVTVRGFLQGVHQGRVGQTPYRFPEVQIEELVLWPAEEAADERPRVRFSIGVGSGGGGIGVGIGF